MNNTPSPICKRCGQPIAESPAYCPDCQYVLCQDCVKELSMDEASYYCPGCHSQVASGMTQAAYTT